VEGDGRPEHRSLWQRHHDKEASRDRVEAQWRADQAMFGALDVDYRSWKTFYEADDARRTGTEVTLCDVEDGELAWRITWFTTTEVVAWARRWRDEASHPGVVKRPGGPSEHPHPVAVGIGPESIPELISLIGRAATTEEARHRLAAASSLADARAALLLPTTP
jgi:hypothetical protein